MSTSTKIIRQPFVSFEVAELAKRKGFDTPIYDCWLKGADTFYEFYCRKGQERQNWNIGFDFSGLKYFSAPTVGLMQYWLAIKHEIIIMPFRESTPNQFGVQVQSTIVHNLSSYDEAINVGLYLALSRLPDDKRD